MAVEAALVTPLLVLLIIGIIEMSLAMRDYAVVASDTRVGVRIASTAAGGGPGVCGGGPLDPPCTPASTPALAQMAANAIQRAGSAMPEDNIEFILIYRANVQGYPGVDGNTTMPSTCAGVPACVRFTWRDDLNEFRYAGGAWASTSISACFPGTALMPLERVGVYLQANHPMVTGMFGASIPLSDRTVLEFEPLPAATCRPGFHP